ncbi:MAG: cysteine desulfurase [Caldilineaceae bacterium]|nr:cysteine desulfurase [Caldilineaceae bacterium]MBP8121002.1 cysteine desulfurase [Caldilineaceae bacterium]MBP9071783.1 cysteine desulfurase [Caldilineaceae bacterium]
MPDTIYMDHSATTPVRPEVMAAMLPYFADFYGNPSSIHRVGRKAHAGLDQARRTIAQILGAKESEIIFNACGTEGDNAALRGIALARRKATGANRIITLPIEHKAVLYTALDLAENYGFDLTLIPVDPAGRVDVATIRHALGDGTDVALVSVMAANNEVGTVQPIAQIGALCRERGVPFHTDAVQAAGKLSLDVNALNVDALAVSAHKFYGPKGVGFLYLRQGTPFQSTQTGAGHESDRRAGTENVPLIVGMAAALALVEAEREAENVRLQVLRDRLIGGILEEIEGAHLTGSASDRLPNHASFLIEGVEAEGILIGLDLAGIAASSGSACTNASQRPSHVLEALGVPPLLAAGGLRLSLGHSTTPAQVETLLAELPRIVQRIRGSQPAGN